MTAVDPSKREGDWLRFSAITKEELLAAIHAQRVAVVNVLEHRSKAMIPTSRHIPASQLSARLGELDRGRAIVVYCSGPGCPLSQNAARVLVSHGFHVRVYTGGLEEWTRGHLPLEERKSPTPDGAAKGDDGEAATSDVASYEGSTE